MTDSDKDKLSPDQPAETGVVEPHQAAEPQHGSDTQRAGEPQERSESQQSTQSGSERAPRVEAVVEPQPAPKEKESFVKSYLRKVGKAMIVFAIIGCCFLMFAAWLLISTFDRMISAAN